MENSIKFEVFTAVTMKMPSSGKLMLMALIRIDVSEQRIALQLLLTLFLARRLFPPWRWRWYIPPKVRFLQEPHSVVSQNDILRKGNSLILNEILRKTLRHCATLFVTAFCLRIKHCVLNSWNTASFCFHAVLGDDYWHSRIPFAGTRLKMKNSPFLVSYWILARGNTV
jgi:hypothetical protein